MLRQNRSHRFVVLNACLLLFGFALHAEEGAQQELVELLEAIDSFEAQFTQSTFSDQNFGGESQQSGYIAFKRPGKFLWVVKEPFEQYILLDGDQLNIFDPDLEQLTRSSIDESQENSVAGILMSPSKDLLEEFDVTRKASVFFLIPRREDAEFQEIQIEFQNDQIQSFTILDHFDSTSKFQFSNIRMNEEIASETFEINVPPETEIVELGDGNETSTP